MANIKTYLNNIKTAVFGSEVRDSIHDAIQQCYDDASAKDNANMEVKMARGEYENLGKRLDSHSSQIKDIVTNKADKTTTDNIQTQVNNLILGAVGDGNNAEVVQARSSYKTLNDRLDDMVTKWDRKNIAWEDGKYVNQDGVIVPLSDYSISQSFSTEGLDIVKLNNIIGNSNVSTITFFPTDSDIILPTPTVISTDTETFTVNIPSNAKRFILCKSNSNVTFSCYSDNKIKYNYTDISANIKWNDGYYIDNNGDFLPHAEYSYSDFIELSEGIVIKGLPNINFPCVVYYDKQGNYLSGISNLLEYTTSSFSGDECYIRIVKGTSTGYPTVKIPNKNLFKGIKNNVPEEIYTDISDNISYVSGYIDSTGKLITPFNGFVVSSILKVVDNINISNIVPNADFPNIAFYDKDMKYIDSIVNISSYTVSNPPSGACYMRVATIDGKPLKIIIPNNYLYEDIGVFLNQSSVNKSSVNKSILLPQYIDSVVGNETTFYIDNLLLSKQATFITDLVHNVVDKGVQFTPSTEKIAYFKVEERDENFNLEISKTTKIRSVSKKGDGSSKNIMIVGDSLIDNPYVASELYRMLNADGDYVINQLGTRGVPNGKHEGRGGWSWSNYIEKSEYNGITNAFYNNGSLDFRNYCTVNGYDGIDYCIIALGTNDVGQGDTPQHLFTDTYINTIIDKAKIFVDALVRDYPNCKIAIGLPSVGGDGKLTSNPNAFHYKIQKLNKAYINTFDNGAYNKNVTTVAHGLFINRRLGYRYTEVPISKRFTDVVKSYSEYVHSNPEGYYCYSDAFYGKIRSWMNGNL